MAAELPLTVLKVGGAELREGPELEALADALASLARRRRLVVVHGGGPEIAELQQRLGLEPCFVEGLRVTDAASCRVAEMVLSGAVNKRLTARLVNRGLRAIGLSGVDAGLLRCVRLSHPQGDLGLVGEVCRVDAQCLRDLLAAGFCPIVSPISLGQDGLTYNVNADHAALAVAGALRADEALFVTDTPGVLRDGCIISTLQAAEAERLIAEGVIYGGMVPKVRSALQAVAAGVGSAVITNLPGLADGSRPDAAGTRLLP